MSEHEAFYAALDRVFPSGVTSTKVPLFQLLPYEGLVRAARRYELGLRKHGAGAWNVLSPNQAALTDKEWLIERLNHVIHHAYKLMAEIQSGKFGEDDNAGAIAWGGLTLGAAVTELQKSCTEKS